VSVSEEGGREGGGGGGRGADTELKTKTPHVNVGKNHRFLPNLQLTLMSIGKSSHVPFTGIC